MESSWRWNAWWAEGGVGPWRLCARLLTPVFGRTHMIIGYPGPPFLIDLCTLRADVWANDYLHWFVADDYGFPYGIPVDQSRFP